MRKIIFAILLIWCAVVLAAEPFTLETIVPKRFQVNYDTESGQFVEMTIVDYQQLQRNFEKIQRKIRETEYRQDSSFVQKGTLTSAQFSWNALGGWYEKIVYLPVKYESASAYRVYFSRVAPVQDITANQIIEIWSDSSFVIKSDTTGNGVYWLATGIRKK